MPGGVWSSVPGLVRGFKELMESGVSLPDEETAEEKSEPWNGQLVDGRRHPEALEVLKRL